METTTDTSWGPNINDCGPAYIKVSAPSAFEAFSEAIDYVAEHYPENTFSFEGPFGVGMNNGALVTGSCYILRGVPNA